MGTKITELQMKINGLKKMSAKYEDELEELYIKLDEENEKEELLEHSFA